MTGLILLKQGFPIQGCHNIFTNDEYVIGTIHIIGIVGIIDHIQNMINFIFLSTCLIFDLQWVKLIIYIEEFYF